MNLFLYLPPLSAHPPSCIKGLIVNTILRYREQNSDKDFVRFTSQFIQQLHERGHELQDITPHITYAAKIIDNKRHKTNTTNHTKPIESKLYLHWDYHLTGLQPRILRQIYNETLKDLDIFKHMTIALSRPNNLRHSLSRTRLPIKPNERASNFMQQIQEQSKNK